MKWPWVALLGALGACAGPKIAGGKVVLRREEPNGVVVARYDSIACTDARGQPVGVPATTVDIVKLGSGRRVLVERRTGYDALVVENSFSKADARFFQVVTLSSDGRPYLRSFRIPHEQAPALLDVTDAFDDTETETGFVARIMGPVALRCRLSAGSTQASTTAPALRREPRRR